MVMVILPSIMVIPMLVLKFSEVAKQFMPHLSLPLSDPKMLPQSKNWDLTVLKLAKKLWMWLEILSKAFFPQMDPSSKMVLYKPSGVLMLFLTLKMLKSLRISCKLLVHWLTKCLLLSNNFEINWYKFRLRNYCIVDLFSTGLGFYPFIIFADL